MQGGHWEAASGIQARGNRDSGVVGTRARRGQRGGPETEGCTALGKGTLVLGLRGAREQVICQVQVVNTSTCSPGAVERVALAWISPSLCFWAC